MTRSRLKSSTALPALPGLEGAAPVTGEAAAARTAGQVVGQAGSARALGQLRMALANMQAAQTSALLEQAVAALQKDDFRTGGDLAIKALEIDERSGFGWYLLAIARERAGDFGNSIRAYEMALALIPEHAEVANDLGRLAYRMGMKETAEKLFAHYVARHPEAREALNNLACAVRDQGRFDEAIEILRAGILQAPEDVLLWNTLGTVLTEQGDPAGATTFFSEALRLDPAMARARYNLANCRLLLGDAAGALENVGRAMTALLPADERLMMQLARATMRLATGDLAGGWEDYEARRDPQFADFTQVLVDRPAWSGDGGDLSGRSLLLVGEQGLGDEILFANVLPDVVEALGPQGRLTIAVEPRLVPLFARSLPGARVLSHATYEVNGRTVRVIPDLGDAEAIDLWAPLASPLGRFRDSLDRFPTAGGYLLAEPERVAHWREVLKDAPPGPKVGILWKSMSRKGARHRYFSPFEMWAPVLRTPGVSFINLQYGDCDAELAAAREELGVEIWQPPGIDLKADLDDVAALTCALDLTLGFANATLNLAGACGAQTWLVSTPGSWPRLGTDRYPWYPQARVFLTPEYGQWDAVMGDLAAALSGFRPEREGR
jgi:Flp pilus assembly protein TadD